MSTNNTNVNGGFTSNGTTATDYANNRADNGCFTNSIVSDIGGNGIGTMGSNLDNSSNGDEGKLHTDSSNYDIGRGVVLADSGSDDILERQLIVVDICGTMKLNEWFGNIRTQFECEQYIKTGRVLLTTVKP